VDPSVRARVTRRVASRLQTEDEASESGSIWLRSRAAKAADAAGGATTLGPTSASV